MSLINPTSRLDQLKSEYAHEREDRDALWRDWQNMVDEWNRTHNYAAKEIGYQICQEAEKRCHELFGAINGCQHENVTDYIVIQMIDGERVATEREVCFDCGAVLHNHIVVDIEAEIPL